jgi:hypothetical protein
MRRRMSAFGRHKADMPIAFSRVLLSGVKRTSVGHSEMCLWTQWVPSRGLSRTEDGPPPLSKMSD